MTTPNSKPSYYGGYNRRAARSFLSPSRIDARAPDAQPQTNQGANPAGASIRAGWGWGGSPATASGGIKSGWGWDRPVIPLLPDFLKRQEEIREMPAVPADSEIREMPARPVDRGQIILLKAAAGAAGKPAQANTAATPLVNPMQIAMQTHPFANGQTLPQNLDPNSFRQTGAGYEALVNSGGGPRWVAFSPTFDQLMHARTGGQWQNWSPAQRSQFLRGQNVTPSPAAQPAPAPAPAAPDFTKPAPSPKTGADYFDSLTVTNKDGSSQVIRNKPWMTIGPGAEAANPVQGNPQAQNGLTNIVLPPGASGGGGTPIMSDLNPPRPPATSGMPDFMTKAPDAAAAGGPQVDAGGGLKINGGGGRIYFDTPGDSPLATQPNWFR